MSVSEWVGASDSSWVDSGSDTEWGAEILSVSSLIVFTEIERLGLTRQFELMLRDIYCEVISEGPLATIYSVKASAEDMACAAVMEEPVLALGSVIIGYLIAEVAIGNVVLQDVHYTLIVDNVICEVISESPTLCTLLTVEGSYCASVIESVELDVSYSLDVSDMTISAEVEAAITLVQQHLLIVSSIDAGVVEDSVALVQKHMLAVQNVAVASMPEQVLFPTYGGLADTRLRSVTTRRSFNLA